MATIRNPIEWGADQLRLAGVAVGTAGRAVAEAERSDAPVRIARIGIRDIGASLQAGLDDFRPAAGDNGLRSGGCE